MVNDLTNEKIYKKIMKNLNEVKITLRLERKGKYIEKSLKHEIISALFDLQFMIEEETKETLKLNKIDKDLKEFFGIVSHICDAMHGNKCYTDNNVEYKDKSYIHGKPEWKKIT